MFKVKCETKGYKYYLKLGDNEVCLSSETPEDDDIKNIVERALEAYHKYQGDKFQQYLDNCYISDVVNANTKDFDMDGVEKALTELVYNDLKDHGTFSPIITSEYITKIKENISDKAIALIFFEEFIDRLCLLNDRINNSISYFVTQNKIVIPDFNRDEVYKHVRLQVLEKCKYVPENKTTEFQKPQQVVVISDSIYNLDRGVIVGFDGEEVLVKIYGYHTHNFAKTSLYVGDIDSRIKTGAEVIFNGEYATIKKIKLVDEKIVYDLKVNEEVVTIQPNELVFAEIDENEKGIFVQINDSSKDYDKWYGRVQYRITQLNSYIVNIRHDTQNILVKSKNITEIDIKNNKNDIQVNDMIKTISRDGRMLFSHR